MGIQYPRRRMMANCNMELVIKSGLDPNGIYVYESSNLLSNSERERLTAQFKSSGLNHVIIVTGGRFIVGNAGSAIKKCMDKTSKK